VGSLRERAEMMRLELQAAVGVQGALRSWLPDRHASGSPRKLSKPQTRCTSDRSVKYGSPPRMGTL